MGSSKKDDEHDIGNAISKPAEKKDDDGDLMGAFGNAFGKKPEPKGALKSADSEETVAAKA